MRFSERYGYKPVHEIIQKESINADLKNRLWSNIYDSFFTYYIHDIAGFDYSIRQLWVKFFKKKSDELPYPPNNVINALKVLFTKNEWFEIYDLIEEIIGLYQKEYTELKKLFIQDLNQTLEEENSAYRVINEKVTEITSEQEIQSIEEALENANPHSGVQQHLNQALKLMSDRQNPDYRNSIKESISSVESICKIVTNDDKATLGKALKIVEDKFGLHPALKGSLSQLYGYTSDGDGIRHAMLEESNLTYIDAKFMLVACTNFINYLIDKTKDQN